MAEVTKINGYDIRDISKYAKPTTGIPKTDLAQDVQNAIDDFQIVRHTFSSSLTVTSGSYKNCGEVTFTKDGYLPLAIAGYQATNGSGAGGTFFSLYNLCITAASVGSVSVDCGVRAVGGKIDRATLYVDVLWKKV